MSNSSEHLKGWINRILEDRPVDGKIEMHLLLRPAGIEIDTVRDALYRWERHGYLKILKDPAFCMPNEPCVQMLKFIDIKSPIPGYLDGGE